MKRPKAKTFGRASPHDLARASDDAVLEQANDFDPPPLMLGPSESLRAILGIDETSVETREPVADLPRLTPLDESLSGSAVTVRVPLPSPTPYYVIAALVSCLIVLAPVLFAWSYQRDMMPFRNDLFALVMVALLALGPAAVVWLTAFILHQTARMAAEARRAQAITEHLTQPTALAAKGAGTVVEQMRREIEHATAAAAAARAELLSLREVLASESERLIEAAEGSSRTATNLTRDLSAEREKMNVLAASLDAQAAGVAEAVGRHARMVAEASDLAEAQLREAEAALTARAADLAAAAGEASDAARVAGEDLSRQVARLETASQGVGDQVHLVETGLTEQRAALVTVAHTLRGDHEAFAAQAETQLARLNEIVMQARDGAGAITGAAAQGAETLGAMLTDAREQLAGMVEAVNTERDLLGERGAETLNGLLTGARDQLAGIVEALDAERSRLTERGGEALDNLLTGAGDQLANIVEAAAHERDLLSASAAQSVGAIAEIAARERQAMEEKVQTTIDNVLAAATEARATIETQAQMLADERDQLESSAGQSLGAISDAAAREHQAMEEQARATIGNILAAAGQARRELEAQAKSASQEREQLGDAAGASINSIVVAATHEREQLEQRARETINALVEAAETARHAVEAHAETARDKVDQLGEAAFAAGQRAESVFESRLSEARALIEQSAKLVDDAGAASVARLGEGVSTARSTLVDLESLLTDVDARIGRLPDDALARADAVRASIERGMEELMASARRAAEETQSIDAAFQDRVRRNYDMLSEAVRLMGVVAGAAGGGARTLPPVSSRPAPAEPRDTRAPEARQPEQRPVDAPRAPEPRPVEARAQEPRPASDINLRPRLRLTPTASDEEFKSVFDAAGGREAPRREAPVRDPAEVKPEGWTWKELLSSMDEEPVVDEAHLAEQILGEIETMGIDAGALLPRARIDELAAAAGAGDTEAVRAGVRRLAPAAIRRLSRRLMSDRLFKAQGERFLERYQALITDAAQRGSDGVVVSALLGSDQGRAYLLFDSAFNDSL